MGTAWTLFTCLRLRLYFLSAGNSLLQTYFCFFRFLTTDIAFYVNLFSLFFLSYIFCHFHHQTGQTGDLQMFPHHLQQLNFIHKSLNGSSLWAPLQPDSAVTVFALLYLQCNYIGIVALLY